MKRKNLQDSVCETGLYIKSEKFTPQGDHMQVATVEQDNKGLSVHDFSINTILDSGYTELLKPNKVLNRSALEENDAFASVVNSAVIETEITTNN